MAQCGEAAHSTVAQAPATTWFVQTVITRTAKIHTACFVRSRSIQARLCRWRSQISQQQFIRSAAQQIDISANLMEASAATLAVGVLNAMCVTWPAPAVDMLILATRFFPSVIIPLQCPVLYVTFRMVHPLRWAHIPARLPGRMVPMLPVAMPAVVCCAVIIEPSVLTVTWMPMDGLVLAAAIPAMMLSQLPAHTSRIPMRAWSGMA